MRCVSNVIVFHLRMLIWLYYILCVVFTLFTTTEFYNLKCDTLKVVLCWIMVPRSVCVSVCVCVCEVEETDNK